MQLHKIFSMVILFSIFLILLLLKPDLIEASSWSQTSQMEFETNTLSQIDTSTSSGDVTITGAYSSDSNTVLLLHMNESGWNGTSYSAQQN